MGLKGILRSHLSPPLWKPGFVEEFPQNTSSAPRLEAGRSVAGLRLPEMCAPVTGAALQHWWPHGGSHPRGNPSPLPARYTTALCRGALTSVTGWTLASDPSSGTQLTVFEAWSPKHLSEPVAVWQGHVQIGTVPCWGWYEIFGLQERTKNIRT